MILFCNIFGTQLVIRSRLLLIILASIFSKLDAQDCKSHLTNTLFGDPQNLTFIIFCNKDNTHYIQCLNSIIKKY